MSELTPHTENASPKRVACHQDVGFGFRCMREKGHAGFCTWDPKRVLGEDPVTDEHDLTLENK